MVKKHKRSADEVEAEVDAGAEDALEELEATLMKKKKKKKQKVEDNIEQEEEVLEEAEMKTKKRKKKKADTVNEEDTTGANLNREAEGEELSKTVFVRGLPWSVGEDMLKRDFGECGELSTVDLMKDPAGRSKGVAFLTYKEESGVLAVLAYDGEDYGGRRLEVRRETGEKGKGKGKGKAGKDEDYNKDLEVFIRGLGPKTKEYPLSREFSNCGEIARLKMDVDIGNGGICKGYAWITFVDQEGMDKALEKHGTEYKGYKITVEKSGEHKNGGKGAAKGPPSADDGVEVFIRGLSPKADESVVRKDFLECGKINKMNMPKDNDGNCKGFAWLTFKTKEGADKAVAYNGEIYGGSKLMVEIAGQHKAKGSKGKGKAAPGPKPAGCTSVVVKKLAYEASESDLSKFFAKCGSGPVDMKILMDWNTGKSKGIAFVDFDSEKAVDEAMKLSGGVIKGHAFFMDYAKPRESR